jgi:mycofactocin precursor
MAEAAAVLADRVELVESDAVVPAELVTEDVLVEEVSIDGMCGVY